MSRLDFHPNFNPIDLKGKVNGKVSAGAQNDA